MGARMNANELADMLAKSSIRKVSQGEVVVDIFEIATMLRQQQTEIAELEIGLKNVWKIVEGKQAEIEALKAELQKYKPQIWEVMKEAQKK